MEKTIKFLSISKCSLVFMLLALMSQHAYSQASYMMQVRGTNIVVDVPNQRMNDSVELIMYNGFNAINQLWKFETEGKYTRIISSLNQKAMTLLFDKVSGRWKVVQCEKGKCDTPDQQLWGIKKFGNGNIIQSKYKGYILASTDSRRLKLLPKGSEGATVWKLVSQEACQTKRNDAFENYSNNQEKQVSKAFVDKNYPQLISLLNEWKGEYDNLPMDQQELYESTRLASIYYNLACGYSLNNQKDEAIENLRKAIEWGYDDRVHIGKDTDLDNIRNDKRLPKILASIPQKDSYLTVLQKASSYLPADTTGLPHFKYEFATSWRLQQVKNCFKLDSIAGQGDEISKIINLMTWVHNTIPHDGNNSPFCERDAIDLYNYAKANNRGINCRLLATVLNECYLSMGFKSRFMTCLPESPFDPDCHVINCVYSKTLNKWVWMDPSFNAYLKDENGTLLSIEEVRSRLIENKTIILNEDANWNNQNKQTKAWYIDYYMAKNLYWFQCPVNSYFNTESSYQNGNMTYVSLTPNGFNDLNQFARNNGNVIIHDPAYFWQAPQKDESNQ